MEGHVTIMELLLVCVVSTTADESAPVVINMVVREGDDAVLSCSFGSRSIKQELFDWKKDGQKEVFMYNRGTHYNNNPTNQDPDFRGRVFHFAQQLDVGNASVVIRPTKVTDSGSYTCDFPFHQPCRRSHIVLVVDPILKTRPDISGAAPRPITKHLSVTEDGVQLQCEVLGAFPKPVVHWQDRAGNIVPAEEPQVSERGGRYDIILQTTVTKTDYYQCVATQKEINHQVSEETYVNVPVPGAAPEPNIIILGETENGVELQCTVKGVLPEPVVQWQDRAGKIVPAEEPQVSERGGSYDVILQTTVTKTDYYQCVATQKEINHTIYTRTYIIAPHSNHSGWIVVDFWRAFGLLFFWLFFWL